MAGRTSALCAAALLIQIVCSHAVVATPASEGSAQDAIRIGFTFTGVALRDANSTALRGVIADVAGVPSTAVSGVKTALSLATDDSALRAVQVTAMLAAVNLAAPYAKLTAAATADDLAAALLAIDATYTSQSLQVDAPQWVVAAMQPQQAAAAAATTVRFVMSGVALPDVNQIRLRAVIGSVAGVRLEQVHLASVAYAAAAAAGRRMLADGYHTLQVTAAVDAASAAAAGNLLMVTSGAATLADALRSEMGATYRPGSLQVTLPAGTTSASAAAAAEGTSGGSGGGGSVSSHALLGMIIAAAVVLAATLGTTAFLVVHFYRAKAAAAAALPDAKQIDDDVSIWASPYGDLAGGAIVGAKLEKPATDAAAQTV